MYLVPLTLNAAMSVCADNSSPFWSVESLYLILVRISQLVIQQASLYNAQYIKVVWIGGDTLLTPE